MVEQARKNNNNPMELLKQITKDYKPEQMKSLLDRARQFGISDDVLQKIQKDGINAE